MSPTRTATIDPAIVPDVVGEVEGPESRWVRDEVADLPAVLPDRWIAGHHLRGTMTLHRGEPATPAPGAFIPGTLTATRGDRRLVEGEDFDVDAFWSAVGAAREPGPTRLGYGYRLLRIDSIVRDAAGEERIVRGASRLTTPRPPALPAELVRVANVFVPYDEDPAALEVLPVGPARHVRPVARALPRFAAALAAGRARVVFWGDSVTAGGDAGSPAATFPAMATSALAERFDGARIATDVIAHGGSTSRDWLTGAQAECDLDRMTDARPDLVVVEFVNDAGLPAEEWPVWYDEIAARVSALGADLMLTTPHWTLGEWMPDAAAANVDGRPYVAFLRDRAARERIALADVSEAWRALRGQGIPYRTLLNNGINHPDERGHALAAQVIVDQIVAGTGNDR